MTTGESYPMNGGDGTYSYAKNSNYQNAFWLKKVPANDKCEHIIDVDAERKHWQQRSIYKLPACVTNLNNNAYKPRVVSFGPYHYGDETLKPMEEHKHRALDHFLYRSGKTLENCIDSLRKIEQDLKDAYDALPPKWNENKGEFLQLMVRDGCFMLEILRSSNRSMIDYAPNDPIFSNHGRLYIMPFIKRDLLMIENQLPNLVLEKLLAVQDEESQARSDEGSQVHSGEKSQEETNIINWLIFQFYDLDTSSVPKEKSLHVLDVFRRGKLREPPSKTGGGNRSKQPSKGSDDDEIVRSATELKEAGIKITRSYTKSLKDIQFIEGSWGDILRFRGGILKLPPILVDDHTETMLLNLMAYERFHVGAGNEVTAYVFFMDSIINDSNDVKLLHSGGIIQNALGSDKAVADLFNSLSKDSSIDPDGSLNEVHNMVTNYCKKPWPRRLAALQHTYFYNSWALISVVAAFLLFALTITQTGYSLGDYYKS